jgi:endonuclease-3 related protein
MTVINGDPRAGDAGRLAVACRTLVGAYPVDNWWPSRSRFEVMVGAVLVQNTRWANVAAAIRALRKARALRPAGISSMRVDRLQNLIRPAGCQSIKARRLKSLANWVTRAGGLRRLSAQETGRLRAALLGVHGIGPETADAILCFAFNRPVFVADRYSHRWLTRMDLVVAEDLNNYERCRETVETRLNGASIDCSDLHAAIVMHGQSVCGSEPDCRVCPVRSVCPQSESTGY